MYALGEGSYIVDDLLSASVCPFTHLCSAAYQRRPAVMGPVPLQDFELRGER